jgi:hypothetical protein
LQVSARKNKYNRQTNMSYKMKESKENNDLLKTIEVFDNIAVLHPSEEWNQSLMTRLVSVKPYATPVSMTTKISVLVVFIVLLNVGFILNAFISNSHRRVQRNNDLKVISKELLINPVSINN